MKNLKKAIEANDIEEIRKYAHKIKGSSLNLGIKEVATIASEMENNAKDKKEVDYKSYFEKLINLISNFEQKVKNESNTI